jgi:hypothetical protein
MAKEGRMKQVSPPKVKYIAVNLPETGFPLVTFANRFGIERLDDCSIIYFGLATKSGDVRAAYSVVMSDVFVKNSREEWLEYLGKIGEPPDRAIDRTWRPPSGQSHRVDLVNAMRIGRTGVEAELRFYCVSMVAAIDAQKGVTSSSNALSAIPLALLQMSLELQQLLLFALLGDRPS